MSGNDKMAVLIPTMNRPDSLRRTLETFFQGEVIPDELIVVDQSEKANDRNENKKITETYASFAKVKYIYQSIPSLTKARNEAFRECNSEIIIWSDDDVDVNKDTLNNIRIIMSHRDISMIAGWDEYSKESKSWLGYLLGTKSYKNRHIGYVTGSMLGRFPDRLSTFTSTQWAMGFFFVIRKSLMDKWNLKWDEQLTGYAYAEDLDFSYSYYKKSKAEHLKCIMSDKVIVKHLGSQEYRIPSRKHIFMYVINRAYLCYKHKMGKKGEIMMNWCNFWMMVRAFLKKDNYPYYRDAIKKEKNVHKYIKDGIIKDSFYV